ncbi:hypothetical protein ACEQPO_31445 [Bacillus sp. SL00103]
MPGHCTVGKLMKNFGGDGRIREAYLSDCLAKVRSEKAATVA